MRVVLISSLAHPLASCPKILGGGKKMVSGSQKYKNRERERKFSLLIYDHLCASEMYLHVKNLDGKSQNVAFRMLSFT